MNFTYYGTSVLSSSISIEVDSAQPPISPDSPSLFKKRGCANSELLAHVPIHPHLAKQQTMAATAHPCEN